MKEVYNATFQSLPQGTKSDYDGDVLSYLNASLDILDLGCGTGLIGSWFKDYAKKLVGVDVSPTMLDMATKKGCYHELRRGVSEVADALYHMYIFSCYRCEFDISTFMSESITLLVLPFTSHDV